jgi:Raf kinase inhibitor-like YbhB/YbcL family protein
MVGLAAWAEDNSKAPPADTPTPTTSPSPSPKKPVKPVFTLTSPAFKDGKPIPRIHARQPEGKNISPELKWTNPPKEVKEFALLMDDPDAPSPKKPRKEGPWVHWVAAKIPAVRTQLPKNAGAAVPKEKKKKDFIEGKNSWGNAWYDGPLPPKDSGKHRYVFRLYALDAELEVKSGLSKKDLMKKMKGHILGEATLMGTYERK